MAFDFRDYHIRQINRSLVFLSDRKTTLSAHTFPTNFNYREFKKKRKEIKKLDKSIDEKISKNEGKACLLFSVKDTGIGISQGRQVLKGVGIF